jgi:hypothetical protein
MRSTRLFEPVVCALLLGSVMAAGCLRMVAQVPEPIHADISGRWDLNAELSENAYKKLEAMHSSQGGGHGTRGHRMGGLSGGAPDATQMEEARAQFVDAPSWFVLTRDGDRIVLTGDDGRVRTLTANGRKEKINGRDVRTWWDQGRLVSEMSIGNIKMTDTYERAPAASQLTVTSKMGINGWEVSVRRVYDAANVR